MGEEKIDELCGVVRACHITVLLETRTNEVGKILQKRLHGFSIYQSYIPQSCTGRKGYGIAVVIAPSVSESVSLWHLSDDIQALWLRCDGSLFGSKRDVALGAVYLNPDNKNRSKNSLTETFDVLFDEAMTASCMIGEVVMMGDFNAHIGDESEFTDEHASLLEDIPCLKHHRMADRQSKNIDRAGKLLLDLAAAGPFMILTGRGKGDSGEASFVGYRQKRSTRPDHVLLSPSLYNSVVSSRVFDNKLRISDHNCIETRFLSDSAALAPDNCGTYEHSCDSDCMRGILCWCPERAACYAEFIEEQEEFRNIFIKSVREKNVEAACEVFTRLVHAAALHAGMRRCSSCVFFNRGKRIRAGQRKAPWFSDACRVKKARFWELFRGFQDFTEAKKDYRKQLRGDKRVFGKERTKLLLDKLANRNEGVFELLRERKTSEPTPISDNAWKEYLDAHFHAVDVSRGAKPVSDRRRAGLDGRAIAVPLGRGRMQQGTSDGDEFHLPSTSQLYHIVGKYLGKMEASSSPGFESFSVPFIKYACVRDEGNERQMRNVLLPYIVELFHLALEQRYIPREWKRAKLSPIYKKGSKADPGNYRMIAVSGTLYRLYANTLRDLVTDWAVKKRKIPDTQFGFYPGRNTLQPIFILRHLVHAARHMKHGNRPHLHAAFVDFSQAYDTVSRPCLWEHLHRNRMPKHLLEVIQQIYEGDEYVLVDGIKKVSTNNRDEATSLRGVKQGCPLSPLLFSLYINDIEWVIEGCEGAVTGTESLRVASLLFADDLVLTSNSIAQLQKMLRRLQSYAANKGLVVNTGKSQVVNFNSYVHSNIPDVFYDGRKLEKRGSFKYLGMLFDKHLNLDKAIEQAAQPFAAAIRRVRELGYKWGVRDRPHVMLWLFRTYALSAGMYASQVWSTQYLTARKVFENVMQRRCMVFLKRMLRVKNSTSNWVVLRECAQEPLQFYWLRATAKFWNSLLEANSITLRGVLKADMALGNAGMHTCWSRQLKEGLSDLHNAATYKENLRLFQKLDLNKLRCDVRYRQQSIWREAECLSPETSSKKVAVYHGWFAEPLRRYTDPRCPACLPQYLLLNLSNRVLRNVSRFRLRGHNLQSETRLYLDKDRSASGCPLCGSDNLQDEKHMVFDCFGEEVANLRQQYASLFSNIERGDLKAFMLQRHVDVHKFISRLMDICDS